MSKKNILQKGAVRHLVSALTVLAVVLLLALNLLLNYLGVQNLLYIDMTPEEFYTVSDAMKTHTSFINELEEDKKIKITFCSDPDTLVATQRLRMPYFMALGLSKIYPEKVEIETVNVTYNPTAVSQYKANSLSTINPTDIIVSYGERYRIVGADNMWVADTDGKLYSFNGEYRLTSIIMSVTAKERPVAYFVSNHGETYYDPANPQRVENAKAQAIYDLLSERGLEVKTLDLSAVDAIPDDCVLLVINNPREDFVDKNATEDDKLSFDYISETEKLDRYLVKEQGAVIVSKDPTISLHSFDLFLYEWGFDIPDAIVSDEEYHMVTADGTANKILGVYDTDEESYGMAIYENYASLPSAPAMVFQNTGYINCAFGPGLSVSEPGTYITNRNYAPFFYSSGVAVAYTDSDGADKYAGDGSYNANKLHDAAQIGRMDIAGVTTRMEIDQVTGEYEYSYIFCSPSADAFSNEILGNGSYANFEIMSSLVENISRIDEYASNELGGTSFNFSSVGGKPFLDVSMSQSPVYEYNPETERDEIVLQGLSVSTIIALVVLIMAVPVVICAVGIAVRVRRRFR